MLVVQHLEVFVDVIVDAGARRDAQRRRRKGLAAELLRHLVDMVVVNVAVAAGPDEFADVEANLGCDHVGEQRIARDVERHSEEQVGAALVELAAELAIGHIELEQQVAGSQRHARDVRHIPRRNDQPSRIRVGLDGLDHLGDLVDRAAVASRPGSPLHSVYGSEIAGGIGPFIPNGHPVVLEPPGVAVSPQKPEQLIRD